MLLLFLVLERTNIAGRGGQNGSLGSFRNDNTSVTEHAMKIVYLTGNPQTTGLFPGVADFAVLQNLGSGGGLASASLVVVVVVVVVVGGVLWFVFVIIIIIIVVVVFLHFGFGRISVVVLMIRYLHG